jgi:hypothetical protein
MKPSKHFEEEISDKSSISKFSQNEKSSSENFQNASLDLPIPTTSSNFI